MMMAPSAGLREVGEQRPSGQEDEQHEREGNERVHLAAAARGIAQGRSAAAAADRKAFEQTGADVRDAKREQFLIGVHFLSRSARECSRGQDVVREAHNGDPDRGQQQVAQIGPHQLRNVRDRQPARHRSHDRQSVILQPEYADDRRGQRYRHQGSRNQRETSLHHEQEDQDACRQQDGRPVHLVEPAQERSHLRGDPRAVDRNACRSTHLADDHDDRDAGHVAHKHRFGQQISNETQPRQPCREADQPDDDGEARRQHGVARRVAPCKWADGSGGQ